MAALILTAAAPDGAARQDDYRRVVAFYRQSTGIPTVVDTWTAGEVEVWVHAALGERSDWTAQELRAAAMLHTDVWFACASMRCARDTTIHRDVAERILGRVLRLDPGRAYYVERWYDTVATLLLRIGQRASSDAMLSRRALWLPTTPGQQEARAAYRRGLLYEYDACVGSFMDSRPSSRREADQFERRSLAAAADSYRSAVRSDPAMSLAVLHLGRVLMLQARRTEAAELFEQATRSPDPRVGYLANLFLGSLDELNGHLEKADRRYGDAAVIYRSGQAAIIARSQVLGRMGRERDSRMLLMTFLAGRPPPAEPLWTYLEPPRIDLAALGARLGELRAEVRP